MEWMHFLYVLNFVPAQGTYGPAVNTAAKAAFIQSGAASNVEVVKAAAEKRVPKTLTHAVLVYNAASKQEVSWRGRTIDGSVGTKGVSVSLHLEF